MANVLEPARFSEAQDVPRSLDLFMASLRRAAEFLARVLGTSMQSERLFSLVSLADFIDGRT